MARRLIARLDDGSEHEIRLNTDPERALENLTKATHSQWIPVVNGTVRHDSVVAFLIVEDEESRDRAVAELLRELRTRPDMSLEEVRRELERRGIEVPQEAAPRPRA